MMSHHLLLCSEGFLSISNLGSPLGHRDRHLKAIALSLHITVGINKTDHVALDMHYALGWLPEPTDQVHTFPHLGNAIGSDRPEDDFDLVGLIALFRPEVELAMGIGGIVPEAKKKAVRETVAIAIMKVGESSQTEFIQIGEVVTIGIAKIA